MRDENSNREWANSWHFTEKDNAMDYLKMCVRSLEDINRDHWAWKWVCIALHGAIYSFGVCAIKGTDDSSVLEDTTAFIWLKISWEDKEELEKLLTKKYGKKIEVTEIGKIDNNNSIRVSTKDDVFSLKYIFKENEKYTKDKYIVTVKRNDEKEKKLITDYRYRDQMLRILHKEPGLIGFDEVIKRCKNGKNMSQGIKPLVLNREQRYAYRCLKNVFRNEFMHYKPKSWAVDSNLSLK